MNHEVGSFDLVAGICERYRQPDGLEPQLTIAGKQFPISEAMEIKRKFCPDESEDIQKIARYIIGSMHNEGYSILPEDVQYIAEPKPQPVEQSKTVPKPAIDTAAVAQLAKLDAHMLQSLSVRPPLKVAVAPKELPIPTPVIDRLIMDEPQIQMILQQAEAVALHTAEPPVMRFEPIPVVVVAIEPSPIATITPVTTIIPERMTQPLHSDVAATVVAMPELPIIISQPETAWLNTDTAVIEIAVSSPPIMPEFYATFDDDTSQDLYEFFVEDPVKIASTEFDAVDINSTLWLDEGFDEAVAEQVTPHIDIAKTVLVAPPSEMLTQPEAKPYEAPLTMAIARAIEVAPTPVVLQLEPLLERMREVTQLIIERPQAIERIQYVAELHATFVEVLSVLSIQATPREVMAYVEQIIACQAVRVEDPEKIRSHGLDSIAQSVLMASYDDTSKLTHALKVLLGMTALVTITTRPAAATYAGL